MNKILRICLECEKEFYVFPYLIKQGYGKFCSKACAAKQTKNHLGHTHSAETKKLLSKISAGFVGENAHNWKGDKAGYFAIHDWIRKKLGKPNNCFLCKKTKTLVWANKSGKYLRNLTDWIPLCGRCHFYYDKQNLRFRGYKGRFLSSAS